MASSTQNQDRVKEATPSSINEKIEADTWHRVADYTNRNAAVISARINKLDREWDIERYLGVNMSTLALIGLALAYFVHINWLILPAIILIFFFQHSVQGWCPPLPILRLFKIRTKEEIEQEKYALKILRGDLDSVTSTSNQDVGLLREAIIKT
jgi:hypothetical protein